MCCLRNVLFIVNGGTDISQYTRTHFLDIELSQRSFWKSRWTAWSANILYGDYVDIKRSFMILNLKRFHQCYGFSSQRMWLGYFSLVLLYAQIFLYNFTEFGFIIGMNEFSAMLKSPVKALTGLLEPEWATFSTYSRIRSWSYNAGTSELMAEAAPYFQFLIVL